MDSAIDDRRIGSSVIVRPCSSTLDEQPVHRIKVPISIQHPTWRYTELIGNLLPRSLPGLVLNIKPNHLFTTLNGCISASLANNVEMGGSAVTKECAPNTTEQSIKRGGSNKVLWLTSGVMAIFSGTIQIAAMLIGSNSYSYQFTFPILLVQALLAVSGGVLAVLRVKNVAPWLILGSALIYWILKPFNFFQTYTSFIFDNISPLEAFSSLNDAVAQFGALQGWLLYLQGLVPWLLPIAAVLILIAFISSRSSAKRIDSPTRNGETTMSTDGNSVNPGWYEDPNGLPTERYWDGTTWTDQTRPRSAPVYSPSIGSQATTTRPRNGMGSAALTMGILGLFLGWLFSLLAIIFGGVAVGRANRGEATNRGAALWGLWLGIIGLVLWVIILIAILGSST